MSPEEVIRVLSEASPDVLTAAIAQMSMADRDALQHRIDEARIAQSRRASLEAVEKLRLSNRYFAHWYKTAYVDLDYLTVESPKTRELTQADVAKHLVATMLKVKGNVGLFTHLEHALRLLFGTITDELREGEAVRQAYLKLLQEGPPPLVISDGVVLKHGE